MKSGSPTRTEITGSSVDELYYMLSFQPDEVDTLQEFMIEKKLLKLDTLSPAKSFNTDFTAHFSDYGAGGVTMDRTYKGIEKAQDAAKKKVKGDKQNKISRVNRSQMMN